MDKTLFYQLPPYFIAILWIKISRKNHLYLLFPNHLFYLSSLWLKFHLYHSHKITHQDKNDIHISKSDVQFLCYWNYQQHFLPWHTFFFCLLGYHILFPLLSYWLLLLSLLCLFFLFSSPFSYWFQSLILFPSLWTITPLVLILSHYYILTDMPQFVYLIEYFRIQTIRSN